MISFIETMTLKITFCNKFQVFAWKILKYFQLPWISAIISNDLNIMTSIRMWCLTLHLNSCKKLCLLTIHFFFQISIRVRCFCLCEDMQFCDAISKWIFGIRSFKENRALAMCALCACGIFGCFRYLRNRKMNGSDSR